MYPEPGVGKKPGLDWLGFSILEKKLSQKSWLAFFQEKFKPKKLASFFQKKFKPENLASFFQRKF